MAEMAPQDLGDWRFFLGMECALEAVNVAAVLALVRRCQAGEPVR